MSWLSRSQRIKIQVQAKIKVLRILIKLFKVISYKIINIYNSEYFILSVIMNITYNIIQIYIIIKFTQN